MTFNENGVTFLEILNAGLITGGPKISKGKYTVGNNGHIEQSMPIINAIDIDWCKAQVPGISDPITSTSQLLSIIGQLKQALGNTDSSDPSSQTLIGRLATLERTVSAIQLTPGPTGPAGPTGPQGATGPQGPTGSFDASALAAYATTAYVDSKIAALIGAAPETLDTLEELANAIESGEGFERIIQEIEDRIDSYHLEYQIIPTLANVTANSNNATTMKKNDVVTLQFSPNTGYLLPSAVTVQGATYEYTQGTGKIVISNPTAAQISIIITANDKRQCTFNTPTLNQLDFTITSGSKSYYVINDTFTGKLSLKSTADPELYGLPASVSGTNCTISNYNATTGEFTIKCTGAGNMTISATPKDVANYRFAVALETNPIFTVSGGTITAMNVSYISTLEGAMSAVGQCPINFDAGFTAPNSVDVEGAYVWFIIPTKYFNTSNFNFINGNNRYLLKQSNIQDLTTDTKIKECVSITTGKIPYTLVCVSSNGLIGKIDFKKL